MRLRRHFALARPAAVVWRHRHYRHGHLCFAHAQCRRHAVVPSGKLRHIEKILPRTAQIAGSITRLYFFITGSCLLAYWLAGMSFFDAAAHAMTTIATGGFSTRDASLAAFSAPAIEVVAIVFMLASSLPFVAYLQLTNRNFNAFWQDGQIRFFLAAAAAATLVMWFYQIATDTGTGATAALRAAFNTVSILTGTGFTTTDYSLWGRLPSRCFSFSPSLAGARARPRAG